MADEIKLFEAMATMRAMRRLKPDPVPEAVLWRLIEAATQAPSGGNRQPWRFVVLRDRDTKEKLGTIFDELGARMYASLEHTPWRDVPVLVAVCTETGAGAGGASIYPAVQNLLTAAHALGLGSVLTTRWKAREAEVRPLLGLPETMEVQAIVPLGWPDRRYGRGRRLPVREVTYRERYGVAWPQG